MTTLQSNGHTLQTNGISQYYELHGDPSNPPVLLITGLGGVGSSWGPQTELFAQTHYAIVPDHRGTGRSTHTQDGHSTPQLAEDMASLIEHLDLGPVHVVGASTGGAIAEHLALSHPDMVQTITLSGSFARFDDYAQREFRVRRTLVDIADRGTVYDAYACFLFSPRYTHTHPGEVQEWIDRVLASPQQDGDREIATKRIDMIMAHDTLSQLAEITHPTLVICGSHDACTPLPLSEEIAAAMPAAELVVLDDAGHLIELEKADGFYAKVGDFIDRHTA